MTGIPLHSLTNHDPRLATGFRVNEWALRILSGGGTRLGEVDRTGGGRAGLWGGRPRQKPSLQQEEEGGKENERAEAARGRQRHKTGSVPGQGVSERPGKDFFSRTHHS